MFVLNITVNYTTQTLYFYKLNKITTLVFSSSFATRSCSSSSEDSLEELYSSESLSKIFFLPESARL